MEIVVGGGGGEKLYSQNLRDFLRIKEEDHRRNVSSNGSSSRLTLSAILSDKIGQDPASEVESSRTLHDIIREDQSIGRRSWRHLKDKIRLRRNNHHHSFRLSSSEADSIDPRRSTENANVSVNEEEEAPVRMSLMALLAENDRQMGYVMDEEESGSSIGAGAEYEKCCVCMVRRKGAAFIPCGHTFCRQCSRELWQHRGNCPLCNNFIVEILDIF